MFTFLLSIATVDVGCGRGSGSGLEAKRNQMPSSPSDSGHNRGKQQRDPPSRQSRQWSSQKRHKTRRGSEEGPGPCETTAGNKKGNWSNNPGGQVGVRSKARTGIKPSQRNSWLSWASRQSLPKSERRRARTSGGQADQIRLTECPTLPRRRDRTYYRPHWHSDCSC